MIPPPNIPMGLMQPIPGAGMPVLPNLPRMVPPPGAMGPHSARTSQPLTASTSTPVTSVGNIKPPLLSAGGSDNEKVCLQAIKKSSREFLLINFLF